MQQADTMPGRFVKENPAHRDPYGCRKTSSFPKTTLHALPEGLPSITICRLWATSSCSILVSSLSIRPSTIW
ncbi:Transcription Factor Hivep2 [Manis pentadactyla]|nr:Transcription Factor Hivep2 [Manis pentadactyla]